MAKMGRPKIDKPADKKVTVRFTEEEHQLLIEYTSKHDLTMTQVVKLAVMEKLLADQK